MLRLPLRCTSSYPPSQPATGPPTWSHRGGGTAVRHHSLGTHQGCSWAGASSGEGGRRGGVQVPVWCDEGGVQPAEWSDQTATDNGGDGTEMGSRAEWCAWRNLAAECCLLQWLSLARGTFNSLNHCFYPINFWLLSFAKSIADNPVLWCILCFAGKEQGTRVVVLSEKCRVRSNRAGTICGQTHVSVIRPLLSFT